MNNYEYLYDILKKSNDITSLKGWTFMLFYPIMKEMDSLNRHYSLYHTIQNYNLECIDSFYFSFDLYDYSLPVISVEEFKRILKSTSVFFPSPIKSYSAKCSIPQDVFSLTNYHDASPCFYLGADSFRVNIEKEIPSLKPKEKNTVFSFVKNKIIEANLVQKDVAPIFEIIISNYINRATEAFPIIWGWLKYVVKSKINKVITDQTLAPNQCCVLHILKEHGFNISVLQHQRNVILSDIYPLIYLDFQLSDTYYTWYSKKIFINNYASNYDLPFNKIMQSSSIFFPMIIEEKLIEILESSKRCLLILNAPSSKYIDGTMLDSSSYVNYIKNVIALLVQMGLQVFLRKDPRGDIIFDESMAQIDLSNTLKDALEHYDICVCDRPGGAAIEVMESKGFVFVCSSALSTVTQTYLDCLDLQKRIMNKVSSRIKLAFDSLDLLCFNSQPIVR